MWQGGAWLGRADTSPARGLRTQLSSPGIHQAQAWLRLEGLEPNLVIPEGASPRAGCCGQSLPAAGAVCPVLWKSLGERPHCSEQEQSQRRRWTQTRRGAQRGEQQKGLERPGHTGPRPPHRSPLPGPDTQLPQCPRVRLPWSQHHWYCPPGSCGCYSFWQRSEVFLVPTFFPTAGKWS